MNIAMLSFHTCPLATLGGKDTGGMNVYVAELTRHLGQLGIRVDVFTRSQDEHVPHVLHNLGYFNRVVHIPAGPEVPLPKRDLAAYIPEFVEGIIQFASQKNIHYDLIHSHYWLSGIAAENLKSRWFVPVIHMFHTLVMMKNRVARSPEEQEGDYRLKGEKRILQIADRIVVATPAEQSQLEFLYKASSKKLRVIPPGVDLSHFYPIPQDEAREVIGVPLTNQMILFVGRIEPLKGLETLLRALAYMQKTSAMTRIPHSLVIVGGNPEETPLVVNAEMARLQTLVRELDIRDLVLFLGKKDQQTLPYYYSAADVVVVPSHYESFGMVALEAMACGTPVVASQVGGLGFLIRDGVTGYAIPDGEPELLGNRLMELILNPDLRKQLGSQASQLAQDYSWERIAKEIIQLYKDILQPQVAVNRQPPRNFEAI
ncbi:MAG: glycosyltransferase [Chloroflexota bacterium]|jgi:D-inositol-3-phosphate glycosyltransferase